jgi:cysteinyl-tRNA synthetase
VRFFILSTHYRRPIEYSAEEFDSKRKGLDTFYRLFERVERIAGCAYKGADRDRGVEGSRDQGREEGTKGRRDEVKVGQAVADARSRDGKEATAGLASAELGAAAQEAHARFVESMDDDFNTAGAIAALFDFAGAINRFIEVKKLETPASSDNRQSSIDNSDALAATAALVGLGRLIGLFIEPQQKKSAGGDDITDRVMQILIQIRAHLRKKKDFETADLIRNQLTEAKITLEDRADGTIWRAE